MLLSRTTPSAAVGTIRCDCMGAFAMPALGVLEVVVVGATLEVDAEVDEVADDVDDEVGEEDVAEDAEEEVDEVAVLTELMENEMSVPSVAAASVVRDEEVAVVEEAEVEREAVVLAEVEGDEEDWAETSASSSAMHSSADERAEVRTMAEMDAQV